jgi:hypothetical protein
MSLSELLHFGATVPAAIASWQRSRCRHQAGGPVRPTRNSQDLLSPENRASIRITLHACQSPARVRHSQPRKAEADQEGARAEQVNETVNKILDALRTNGYEPALRIEDVEVHGTE